MDRIWKATVAEKKCCACDGGYGEREVPVTEDCSLTDGRLMLAATAAAANRISMGAVSAAVHSRR